jgi:hypothetical protein
MSALVLFLVRENPPPDLAYASFNLIVSLSLMELRQLLGIAILWFAWSRMRASCEANTGEMPCRSEDHRMTPALLIARYCIIYWVNVWIAPAECMFDIIEQELERRGVVFEGADQRVLQAA